MSREDLHFRLRIPEDLKAEIQAAAEANARSMTSEIVTRLRGAPAVKSKMEDIAPFGLRMPAELKAKVAQDALRNERSMNSEIIARLQGSSSSITKREHFAGQIMQGLLASSLFIDPDGLWTGNGAKPTAEAVVILTDALIAELAKGGGEC